MKYALVVAIESDFDDTNVSTGTSKFPNRRRLESEAIECFTNWRNNAGELKDIEIYAVCPTKKVISEKTKEALKSLKVTYIEEYQPITETFTSGFLNIPLVGKMMEDRLTEDVFIKIDLDMNIIKPLPERWLVSDQVILGQYDDYCTKSQRGGIGGNNPLDTGFMISRRDSKVYQRFFELCMELMNSDDPDWMVVKDQTGDYFLEEHVMDRICAAKEFDFNLVQKYQIGEWYTPVDEFTDEELKEVYFWHEHLESDPVYDKIREKIAYSKRMRTIG